MLPFWSGMDEAQEPVLLMLPEKVVYSDAADDFALPSDEDDSWKKKLECEDHSTVLKNSLRNITLIMENDPHLRGIVFNQLADGMEIKGEVPWKHPGRTAWR